MGILDHFKGLGFILDKLIGLVFLMFFSAIASYSSGIFCRGISLWMWTQPKCLKALVPRW